eukprot:351876-Chlamydomonas_euryale.AAC.4
MKGERADASPVHRMDENVLENDHSPVNWRCGARSLRSSFPEPTFHPWYIVVTCNLLTPSKNVGPTFWRVGERSSSIPDPHPVEDVSMQSVICAVGRHQSMPAQAWANGLSSQGNGGDPFRWCWGWEGQRDESCQRAWAARTGATLARIGAMPPRPPAAHLPPTARHACQQRAGRKLATEADGPRAAEEPTSLFPFSSVPLRMKPAFAA